MDDRISNDDRVPMSLVNTHFNRNVFQNSTFLNKPHENHLQSYEQNHFNGLNMENCDTKYGGYLNLEKNEKKTGFTEEDLIHKPQKNGLIGNFDQNMLFETLKNSNINNNSCNDLFAIPPEEKFTKDDSKSFMNNIHLSNNFDIFSTGIIENSAMDFESIIPYSDLQSQDSLFHSFGAASYSDHEDTRMSNEVDNLNLLCNL